LAVLDDGDIRPNSPDLRDAIAERSFFVAPDAIADA
jgi:hypothetical protein